MDSRRFIYLHISINDVNLRAFEAAEKHEIMSLKRKSLFNIFCMIGDFDVTLLKIIAQINIQALGFNKIHIFCSMIRILTVVQVWNILRATRKKHLELRARGAKTRTVNPSFYCS